MGNVVPTGRTGPSSLVTQDLGSHITHQQHVNANCRASCIPKGHDVYNTFRNRTLVTDILLQGPQLCRCAVTADLRPVQCPNLLPLRLTPRLLDAVFAVQAVSRPEEGHLLVRGPLRREDPRHQLRRRRPAVQRPGEQQQQQRMMARSGRTL